MKTAAGTAKQRNHFSFAAGLFIGVFIFVGLTAYDVQRIKQMYYQGAEELVARCAISGALSLYLDFINLFLYLLRIFGDRR